MYCALYVSTPVLFPGRTICGRSDSFLSRTHRLNAILAPGILDQLDFNSRIIVAQFILLFGRISINERDDLQHVHAERSNIFRQICDYIKFQMPEIRSLRRREKNIRIRP